MLWLDSDKKVVYMQNNANPKSYPTQFCPDKLARYVLETKAGTNKSIHLQNGNQAELDLH
jgi:uncharacterized membrane protein (UPF0127 family)